MFICDIFKAIGSLISKAWFKIIGRNEEITYYQPSTPTTPTQPVTQGSNVPDNMLQKRAILFGINQYVDRDIPDLSGCVNDVLELKKLLFTVYDFDEVETVIDFNATKTTILDKLDYYINKTMPGDKLVIGFSGHGSYKVDLNGDEIDGYDEILCPSDMTWNNNNFISDDDLAILFKKAPKGSITFICDSCFSGTITDQRFIAPPIEMRKALEEVNFSELRIRRVGVKAGSETTQHHILFAMCKENQTSTDTVIDNKSCGAGTYYFIQALRKLPSSNWKVIHDMTMNLLKVNEYEQIPVLNGSAELLSKVPFK